jgi:hypothetical protein
LLQEQAGWWEATEKLIRGELQRLDAKMEESFRKKNDKKGRNWAFELAPGDKVLLKQTIPGKSQ